MNKDGDSSICNECAVPKTAVVIWLGFSKKDNDRRNNVTMTPVAMATILPQYVLGTISPYPIERNVIAIIHIEFRILACWLGSSPLKKKNETSK